MEVSTIIYGILLIIADVFGILLNLSSLWYFITSCKKGLYNHLIILLGAMDTIMCLFYISLASYHSKEITCEHLNNVIEDACSKSYKTFLSVLPNLTLVYTVVVTCVISVIRSISIIFPFFQIRKRFVYGFLLIFSMSYVALKFFTACNRLVETVSVGIVIHGLAILIASVTGFPSFYILIKRSQHNIGNTEGTNEAQENITIRNHRRASFTIFILTAVCIAANIIGFPLHLVAYITCSHEGNSSDPRVNYYSKVTTAAFLLNSICNPIVLIARKKEIRDFLMSKVRKVMSLLR